MGSIAKKGLQQYLLQLQQHPLRTKSITAGVLSAISDIVTQKITGIQKLQVRRLLLKVLFGVVYLGPFGHFLHLLLDKIFKGKRDKSTVAKKVLLEQVTSSPWNNLLFMVYYGLVIERRPWIQVKSNIKREYPKVQYTAWTFWPVVGWVNHQYVPLQFRVIFHSIIACCWGIFLNLRARFQRRARLVQEQELISGFSTISTNNPIEKQVSPSRIDPDPLVIKKLYAIKEAVADRVEMHRNIGEQRSQWNNMLLTSINGIILAAATMVGIAATSGDSVLGLKMSSTLLYLAATGMLVIINKIQPSQLAEEQRNATRLFQDLYNQIETTLSIGYPSAVDVKEAMDRVLALDKAYPLPLLGVMLDKFPSSVEPAIWWPQQRRRQPKRVSDSDKYNGWNGKLEEEMKEIMGVLGRKDQEEYISLGEKALKLNKFLAISGPLLTGLAAVGSAFADSSPSHGSWAAMLGIVGGALASVVNTVEHGGQVGMVFEMYRGNAGFFRYMQESIESNLTETDMERRENGEVFEMKMALKLGRSLSDLRDIAAASSSKGEGIEFGSKLF
ncbi:putative f-box protein [Nicotiana attenuata]|uniref:F-box protein n=1 Tax=Nicotiana attenuata TaxID=49451 RepID=A0A1J6I4G4_NICAT|nr:putative f-box protein [Nicotiana attenuata]